MRRNIIFSFTLLLLGIFSCKEDDIPLDAKTASLVQSLEQELHPLTVDNPLLWSDDELRFLDPVGDKAIVALGEATHGTAEFFKAKHRVFRYLVENHGYKVFAFEADFGESLFINEAVQRSRLSDIESLMRSKMHFWTWRTEEVKDLLEWMCEYNLGKSAEEKVQYMGVDCQYNTFHPDLVKDYLQTVDAPFFSYAAGVLDEAKSTAQAGFTSYTAEAFTNYLEQIDALQDSIVFYESEMIGGSSEKEYQLYARILQVVRQVSEVRYYGEKGDYSINYRDQYMAENTAWLHEYFDGKKVVLWAHNGHIANDPNYGTGSIGHHLHQGLANDYATIGFLFSRGSFTAVGYEGEQRTGLGKQVLNAAPQANSINAVMSHAEAPVFSVRIADLQKYSEWNEAFADGIQYFQMGAAFNNEPEDYYSEFSPALFDYIIYFDHTTASIGL